jgi:hypothetical protein
MVSAAVETTSPLKMLELQAEARVGLQSDSARENMPLIGSDYRLKFINLNTEPRGFCAIRVCGVRPSPEPCIGYSFSLQYGQKSILVSV